MKKVPNTFTLEVTRDLIAGSTRSSIRNCAVARGLRAMFGLPYGAAIVDPASAAINGVVYDHDGGLFIAAYDRYSTIAAPTTILFWRRVPPGTARSEMPA